MATHRLGETPNLEMNLDCRLFLPQIERGEVVWTSSSKICSTKTRFSVVLIGLCELYDIDLSNTDIDRVEHFIHINKKEKKSRDLVHAQTGLDGHCKKFKQ
ncbi:hypothetical protein J6590_049051 [Homalodisca vitripennis]|nr:hypothetical protein J6590_049051 [Homalodisca vitripennis]